MAVKALAVDDDGVTLVAPLEPNINHHGTAFGGSASTLATLAAWSALHVRLFKLGVTSQLVIQRNTMEYTRPIFGELVARAVVPEDEEWGHFVKSLARKGRGRLRVYAVITYDGEAAGKFVGDFVALRAVFRNEEEAAFFDHF